MKKLFLSILLLASTSFAETGVIVDVGLSPAGSFKAKTQEVDGKVILQGAIVKAQNIKVSLKNLKSGLALRDKHMTEKYLQVDQFPHAILTSATGQNGRGQGKIKIRGIEKDVEGTYKIENGELTADFPIKLSDFGITGIRYMGVGVNDNSVVHITVPVQGP